MKKGAQWRPFKSFQVTDQVPVPTLALVSWAVTAFSVEGIVVEMPQVTFDSPTVGLNVMVLVLMFSPMFCSVTSISPAPVIFVTETSLEAAGALMSLGESAVLHFAAPPCSCAHRATAVLTDSTDANTLLILAFLV